ncbi:aspartate aminotransferase family protein [Actinotalea sp. M2MS4P-6]|uniref:aspartate aminotransferase family protein n=1 Tax=Actinotalea sp. M2MS4P-6 TaxID=2983762 RepID=UPI0021E50AC5|nr:aspartate aminotransferase family protein [Actinotalea sp. M2MS4P-6]MCV2392945.1 aspartate aminotransferase family protein [Actinotalea sp. M2MS4P-6]
MATRSTIMDTNSFRADGAALPQATAQLVRRRGAVLGPSYRLFYRNPVHLVAGHGAHLTDADGHDYLDVYNNVASVGHAHPRVVAAMAEQAATLNTHTRYLHDAIVGYSEDLLSLLPDEIDRVMFLCTGSEANDLAVRVAQAHTGGTGVVVSAEAYHGNTALTSGLSPALGTAQPLGADVRLVPAPDAYRLSPPSGLPGWVDSEPDVGTWFADQVARAIADLERHGTRFAALLVDSIFSSDGVYPEPVSPSFLAPAVEVVHRAGGVLIADEVQPGFARTGTHFWGFARHGVVPDLVTMGKPMGNGIPVSGLAARSDVLATFGESIPYFNTFGGNPVSIAAAQAVLDVMREEDLQGNALRVGAQMLDGLRALAADHPRIGDIRGAGLYVGVDVVTDRESRAPDVAGALDLVEALRERRVLTSVCGPGNVLKLRPPLAFDEADLDRLLTELGAALAELGPVAEPEREARG